MYGVNSGSKQEANKCDRQSMRPDGVPVGLTPKPATVKVTETGSAAQVDDVLHSVLLRLRAMAEEKQVRLVVSSGAGSLPARFETGELEATLTDLLSVVLCEAKAGDRIDVGVPHAQTRCNIVDGNASIVGSLEELIAIHVHRKKGKNGVAQDGAPGGGQVNASRGRKQSPGSRGNPAFPNIITQNESMLERLRYVESIAGTDDPILITGETGVGKELVARAIHRLSGRLGDFVAENVGSLDDAMICDTLFGHARGAFTGAQLGRRGLVAEAAGGTLLLDEIGEMTATSQVKLLRFIEERQYRSLGSDRVRRSSARIIIATNANAKDGLSTENLRKDLFYRMKHHVHLPPLRARLDDLSLLVDHFAMQTAHLLRREPVGIPDELLALLQSYDFPGNVRELKNIVENSVRLGSSKMLNISYFRHYVQECCNRMTDGLPQSGFLQKRVNGCGGFPRIVEMENYLVSEAMRRTKGNQNAAAKLLGLSPSALSRRISKARSGRSSGRSEEAES